MASQAVPGSSPTNARSFTDAERDEVVAVLTRDPFFHGVPEAEIRTLAEGRSKAFTQVGVSVTTRTRSDLVLLMRGWTALVIDGNRGRTFFRLLGDQFHNRFIGASVALIGEGAQHTVDMVTMSPDVRVAYLEAEPLRVLATKHQVLWQRTLYRSHTVGKLLTQRIAEQKENGDGIEEAVATWLWVKGTTAQRGLPASFPVNHAELQGFGARMGGSVSSALERMEEIELIAIERTGKKGNRTITIHTREALTQLGDRAAAFLGRLRARF